MRSVLITPMSPRVAGNGLAQRCAMWHTVLAGLGSVVSVVTPVAGPAAPDGNEVVLRPSGGLEPTMPGPAQGLTVDLGRAFGSTDLADVAVDLVVVVRSYLGRLGIGVRNATGAVLVVDLDDDDASFVRSMGDDAEAARYEHLVQEVRASADLVVSTQGFAGTRAVPNSVRVPEPRVRSTRVAAASTSAPRVVTVGNMKYAPNVDGARWLIDAILPSVVERVPEVELDVVGPGSEALVPFGRGYVPDLREVLDGAAVVVAPLLHGSGTRIKILDALAHGRPVVSTTVGADGLGAVDGVHLLIADDAASFAAAIVRVLEDASLGAALGSAGRRLVTARYSRPRVVADVQELLRAALGPAPSEPP